MVTRRIVGQIAAASLALAACRSAKGTDAAGGGTQRAAPSDRARQNSATDSDFVRQPVGRVEELFAGRFPGVQVLHTPGQGIIVRIRGATSLMGSNDPLYVVDGFPIEAGPGGLLGINPYDIAKIEVLKDAARTAEYGVRGGNGVVLITTKREH